MIGSYTAQAGGLFGRAEPARLFGCDLARHSRHHRRHRIQQVTVTAGIKAVVAVIITDMGMQHGRARIMTGPCLSHDLINRDGQVGVILP